MLQKIIAVLFVILILMTGGLWTYMNYMKSDEPIEYEDDGYYSEAYTELVTRNYVTNYPETYLDLINENNDIVLYQYGQEVEMNETENLVIKQRELFGKEILDLNSMEDQLFKYRQELTEFKELDRYITGRKTLASSTVPGDSSMTKVSVEETYNDGLTIQYDYYLNSEGGKWKIYSWERKITKNSDDFGKDTEEE